MKYKITPESNKDLFDKLTEIFERGKTCDQAADQWIIKEFGEYKNHGSPHSALFGGVVFVELKEKPEGWKVEGKDWQRFYSPLAKNKRVWAELSRLPKVLNSELKELLEYGNYTDTAQNGFGFTMSTRPGITICKEFCLIDASKKYQPLEGMIEIIESEFDRLSEKAENLAKK